MADYYYSDLIHLYDTLGLKEGDNLYLASNLFNLGRFEKSSRQEFLDSHYQAITKMIGPNGTLIVPTHSSSIVRNKTAFDVLKTRSETGAFSEYIRNLSGSVRSLHPMFSVTAIGKNAEFYCSNNSRHSYNEGSPYGRMASKPTKCVTLGIEPRMVPSLVHYCEMRAGVPYRYTKEFLLPIIQNGSTKTQEYYHFVNYLECDIRRDKNKKIFNHFTEKYKMVESKIGLNKAYCYSQNEFIESTLELLNRDIYSWLASPPQRRPFQK